MHNNNKIGIIGDKDSILAFKAIGVDCFPTKNYFDAKETLKKLARNYAVIFITEDIAAEIKDVIDRYATIPFPAIIPIPTCEGSNGFGMKNLSKNVEKAIGADILFNND